MDIKTIQDTEEWQELENREKGMAEEINELRDQIDKLKLEITIPKESQRILIYALHYSLGWPAVNGPAPKEVCYLLELIWTKLSKTVRTVICSIVEFHILLCKEYDDPQSRVWLQTSGPIFQQLLEFAEVSKDPTPD